jgi:hypothetical protein
LDSIGPLADLLNDLLGGGEQCFGLGHKPLQNLAPLLRGLGKQMVLLDLTIDLLALLDSCLRESYAPLLQLD